MTNRARLAICTLSLALSAVLVPLGASPAVADTSFPYGDRLTAHAADQMHAGRRIGWYATELDAYGYHGRRHAEEARIPGGHGRRWVGIIHVPAGKGAKAQGALVRSRAWFARNGTAFVLPLQSSTYTNGGSGASYRTASRFAAQRLGTGWVVVAPAVSC